MSPLGYHEDIVRTRRGIERDGRVLRFTFVAVISNYCTNPGGMQKSYETKNKRLQEAIQVAQKLAFRWPDTGYAEPG